MNTATRISALALYVAALALPRIAGWPLARSVAWYALLLAVAAGTRLALSRAAGRWDLRGSVPGDETVRLVLPVRKRAGRVPYALLGEEFALALTDRHVLLQRRAPLTGRPVGELHRSERTELRREKFLTVETASGSRMELVVPMAHRPEVARWSRDGAAPGS
ncbi:hypothetical protein GCM10009801_44570 [Streptomyces albiaxialis]|uniref:DUF58 domain-containing protein n=1 Tax=Streptomyces albiaxialis TaxID=329523 RepID=A0ABN2W8H5_9ACTN